MQRIVVSGGSGYIGRGLVKHLLARGDEVTVLTRRPSAPGEPRLVHWDPYQVGDWAQALDGADAIVNLTGEQAVGVRFTEARKRRIHDSRVITTRNLASAIERAARKPRVLVSVSGIGYYGDRPASQRVDESVGPGSDFLAQLCVEWEAAAEKARDSGVRVVTPRMGIVLGPGEGGPLETMALPFKLFVGGKLGSGQQGFSWIYLDDAVAALSLCIDEDISGPVNVCSPQPASNAQVSEQLARALARPSWLSVPAFGLKLLFGEGAAPILTGQYAVPKALESRGFHFQAPSLPEAISRSL